MSHQADLTDSCKIRPAPGEDGAGSAGRGAARRRPGYRPDLGFRRGAGDGNRTRTVSLGS